jgi:hypothetical protein
VARLDLAHEPRLAQESCSHGVFARVLGPQQLQRDGTAVLADGDEHEAVRSLADETLERVAPDAPARAELVRLHGPIISASR